MNLYELATQDAQLYEMLSNDEDIPADQLYAILESSQEAINVKASRIAAVIKALEADADKLCEMATKYTTRAKYMHNNADRLREFAISAMKSGNITQAGDTINGLKLMKPRASVQIDDMDQLQDQYKRTKIDISADKKAIKDAIDSGVEVAGASLRYNDSLKVL